MKTEHKVIRVFYGKSEELLKKAQIHIQKKKEKETFAGRLLLIEGTRFLFSSRLPFSQKGIEQLEAEIEKTPNGKPYFREHQEVHFNISHSGEYVVCAVGPMELGIDIQEIRPWKTDRLLCRVMNEKEIEEVLAAKVPEAAFTAFWAKKESFLKLEGTGIRKEIKNLPLQSVYMDGFTLEDRYICRICAKDRFILRTFRET